ncbi:MAG TPA: ArsA family ATPase [Candidatus Pelethocola excrementipullorum]|nr:ArsA family ATPase [Candidatus Pelethocola excrementipullorum]
MGRILIFTGKGGVGKSSLSAAHARSSALEGKKTLLVSTDMAHNLGDIFSVQLGKEAKEIAPNLDALEIDPAYVMEHDFQDMMRAIINMISSERINASDVDVKLFPGVEELFSLLKILDIYESGMYERIIIDCAPTGETLALLKFPELFSWYIEKLFPIGRVVVKVLAPISKRAFKLELPGKKAMNDIERLYYRLFELQQLLKDRETTSVRLVTIPEKMVVEETKRNYMYMNLYDYHVDGVYINRILPQEVEKTFFDEWIQIQAKYIKELEETFSNLPIYRVPWFDTDLNGVEGIDRIVKAVLDGQDVFAIHDSIAGERYEENDRGYVMYVTLPFVGKEDVDMHMSGTDIIIKIGNFKRNIPIPNILREYSVVEAKLNNGELKIQFEN